MGVFEAGRLFVLIDRRDYWQCAFVFPKGRAEEIRDEGIDAFRKRVAAVGPETAAGADAISGWDDVKLLTVSVDRSEERRVGKECGGKCRSGWARYHEKKKNLTEGVISK